MVRDGGAPGVAAGQAPHQRLVPSHSANRLSAAKSHLDAIIVPSVRPASFLEEAVGLALAADTWLVVLSSGRSDPVAVCQLAADSALQKTLIVEVSIDFAHPVFDLATSQDEQAARLNRPRRSDLSLKRNIGLAIARLVGWDKIFFLDDDVRDLTLDHISGVASLLDRYNCASFSMSEFPDNSVVSHARRLINGTQREIFLTGAAMGLSARCQENFFPNIYNEDLFFAFDHIVRASAVHAGSLSQIPYNPFDRPDRAESEEFGEVLVGGLLAILHQNRSVDAATRDYWREFIPMRMAQIRLIRDSIEHPFHTPLEVSAMKALTAAMVRLSEITPEDCASYVAAWREDRTKWQRSLHELPTQIPLSRALNVFGLTRCC
jgi:hypothetical protein